MRLPLLRTTSNRVHPPKIAPRGRELLSALPLPALFCAWLGLLLANFGATVGAIYANADIVSAPVIGELLPQAPPDAETVLGYHAWYTTLWFELATDWVPFHRVLWETGPWLASVAGILGVAWATAKVAGWFAASLVAFTLVCSGEQLLTIQFASDLHGATAVTVCVLNAFLVLLVLRDGRIGSTPVHVGLCGAVGALAAAGLASDDLLYFAGLGPFVVAGLAQLWWQEREAGRRIALSAVAVTAFAIAGSRVALAAMHARHVDAAPFPLNYVAWNDLLDHLTQLAQSLAGLFNADFAGAGISARSLLTAACALVLAAGVVVAWRQGRDQLRRTRHRHAVNAAREAHITFWVLAVLLPAAGFVLTSQAGAGKARYLIFCAYGIVALAAVALAGKGLAGRAAGVAAACVVVSGSIVAAAAHDLQHHSVYPTRSFAKTLETFADGEGLRVGYAAYWDAAPLTWDMRQDIQIYPVDSCGAAHGLCRASAQFIDSWYTPRPETKTFLLVDPIFGPSEPENRLGNPTEVVRIDRYTIYVYDYDIAANVGPPQ